MRPWPTILARYASNGGERDGSGMVAGRIGGEDESLKEGKMIGQIIRFFERLLSVGGIAGLIAIAITISICTRYVQNGAEEIPQVLTYALTTILGFYFGTGVARQAPSPPEP